MMTPERPGRPGVRSLRGALLAVIALSAAGALLVMGPIPQPESYHRFADSRALLGVFGFLNVVSNAPLVLAGAWGLAVVLLKGVPAAPALRPAYLALFTGAFLSGLASAWYHRAPDNATLLWDRMAMTITFASFTALVVGERIRPEAVRLLLPPMALFGLLSTTTWYRSELAGAGDLRLYLLVQFLPLLLAPLILLLWRSPTAERRHFGLALAAYALAKIAEALDSQTFQLTGVVSGHTLKHLLAAAAVAALALGAARRPPGPPQ